jgi:hypothetical protein
MNHTDPKVLDLWIAWLCNDSEAEEKGAMVPAEQAFGSLFQRLRDNGQSGGKLRDRSG